MDAWTKQTGFPVLELQKVNSDGSLVLEQRRFFADGAADTENTTWPVPLFASVDGTQQSIGVMASQKETVPFADAKKQAMEGFERRYLLDVLQRADGNISQASRLAGLDRSNFRRMLKRHDLSDVL